MKVIELLESKEPKAPDLLVGLMLMKLYKSGKPLRVKLTGLMMRDPSNRSKWVEVEDQEWDITKVTIHETGLGNFFRVHNTSFEDWFELHDADDEHLTLKNMGDYWLLTSRDGKGVSV